MDRREGWLLLRDELFKLSASVGGWGSPPFEEEEELEKGATFGSLFREKMDDFPPPDGRDAVLEWLDMGRRGGRRRGRGLGKLRGCWRWCCRAVGSRW